MSQVKFIETLGIKLIEINITGFKFYNMNVTNSDLTNLT